MVGGKGSNVRRICGKGVFWVWSEREWERWMVSGDDGAGEPRWMEWDNEECEEITPVRMSLRTMPTCQAEYRPGIVGRRWDSTTQVHVNRGPRTTFCLSPGRPGWRSYLDRPRRARWWFNIKSDLAMWNTARLSAYTLKNIQGKSPIHRVSNALEKSSEMTNAVAFPL